MPAMPAMPAMVSVTQSQNKAVGAVIASIRHQGGSFIKKRWTNT